MRIALIADAYPPLRTSGAVQLRDLALELARQGHAPTVLIPDATPGARWRIDAPHDGVRVVRLGAPRTKDIGYLRRTLGELWMPHAMLRNLRASPLRAERWDGVVWYSPSIFLGPLAGALKRAGGCRGYLILRDIFPEWAVDMGLMSRGLPYRFFKAIERYQYSVADVIGVQTPANRAYLAGWAGQPGRRLEVLQNWHGRSDDRGCSLSVRDTPLAGRKLFVYAGNMGVAQGMPTLLALAQALRTRTDLGFLFVGRGSEVPRLREQAAARGLDNVAFHDEIDPREIPGLYAQCHVGLVALDPRHRTHNIPGKFVSYMQCGLPVLACVNPGNDLVELIAAQCVGRACTEPAAEPLAEAALALLDELQRDRAIAERCRALAARLFSPDAAARQIAGALEADADAAAQPNTRSPSANGGAPESVAISSGAAPEPAVK